MELKISLKIVLNILIRGHCHPEILSTVKKQASTLTITSGLLHNDVIGNYYKLLTKITGYGKVIPMNSGIE